MRTWFNQITKLAVLGYITGRDIPTDFCNFSYWIRVCEAGNVTLMYINVSGWYFIELIQNFDWTTGSTIYRK